MTLWIENLRRLVALVDAKLAEAKAATGEYSHADYDAWRRRHVDAETVLIKHFTDEEAARWAAPGNDYAVVMAGIRSSSTSGYTGALTNWRASAQKNIEAHATAVPEEACPGHVASDDDPKVCGRCGIHIDSLRPDDDVVNLQGSGPAPIEPREDA